MLRVIFPLRVVEEVIQNWSNPSKDMPAIFMCVSFEIFAGGKYECQKMD